MARQQIVLEGRLSAEAVLAGGWRDVERLLVADPADRRLARLRQMAAARGVAVERASRADIEELVSGRSHGGVAAVVGARRYLAVEELLERAGPGALVVMLDGVEDPFNFGQAVRALYAADVDGLVVRARSWETAAGVVARASAGASELMPTATAPSAESAALSARAAGLRVAAAAARRGATPLTEADLGAGLFLLIGGERRGVTRSFLAGCDLIVSIPAGRPDAPELGVAAAAAVLAFEALRQRTG